MWERSQLGQSYKFCATVQRNVVNSNAIIPIPARWSSGKGFLGQPQDLFGFRVSLERSYPDGSEPDASPVVINPSKTVVGVEHGAANG